MEISNYRYIVLDIVSNFPIYRRIELSIYRKIKRILPFIPWHPRVLMQILDEIFEIKISKSYTWWIFFFAFRHRIDLDSDIDIPTLVQTTMDCA